MPSADNELTKSIKDLMKQRETIEREISMFQIVLDRNNFRIGDKFVDAEDFPRTDINVYEVRGAVNKIVCLQNDYKGIMKQIEDKLAALHSQYRNNTVSEPDSSEIAHLEQSSSGEPTDLAHFALIKSVVAGSPAAIGGLIEDDKLVQFGSLNTTNFKEYSDFSKILQNSYRKTLAVKVVRNGRLFELSVTPNVWSGPGWLGCTMVLPQQ